MEITVRDIMRLEPLQGARILAGQHMVDNIVKGITIIEAPDIVDWLSGGEVLLTSLYNTTIQIESYREYIRKMVHRGVSALIIKTGRVVPEIPQEIRESGNEFGLPIIEIDKEIKYIDIMYPVMAELFNKQVVKLQYYKEVQDRFTELVIKGEGLEGICRALEELVRNPVVIYDKKFGMLASTDRRVSLFGEVQENAYRENLNEKMYYYRQEVVLPELDNQKVTQVVIPIQQLNQINAYLVVVEKNHKLGELEFIILENASTVISLELVKRFAIGEVERKFKYDLLDSLVNGGFHLETILERASLMGWDLKGAYSVVLIEFKDIDDYLKDKKSRSTFITEIGATVGNVINEFTHHFMRIRSDSLYVLWPAGGKSEAKLSMDIQRAFIKIKEKLSYKYKKIKLFTGVGRIAANIQEIPQSYEEAQNALNFGTIINEDFINFSELGIMRLLCKFGENNDLEEFIPQSLNRLLAYDQENGTNLAYTLEVFLKTNRNATQTAKEIFVHYKTVHYRLGKIKEVSGLDLSNHKECLEVELGLKIVSLMKQKRKRRSE